MNLIPWAAGLYEGEGSIIKDKRRRATYRLCIRMTDPDILHKFRSVFNVGSVRLMNSRSMQKPNWKPMWDYRVTSQAEIKPLCDTPYLGIRRGYAALNCIDNIDGI